MNATQRVQRYVASLEQQKAELTAKYEKLLTDYTLMRAVAQYAVDHNQNDPAEVARYAQAMMTECDKLEAAKADE